MDLPSASNAPREIRLNGATLRARTLTLSQLGELLAWLEDRTGVPLIPLSADEARIALATTDGLAVILHLSLLSCQPSLTRDEAVALAATLDDDTEKRLKSIAFRRRPGYAPPEDGSGKDLAESDWGGIWEGLSQGRADRYEAVGNLTLDQLDCRAAKGELDGPDTLKPSEVQAMWEAAQKNGEGGFTEAPDAV